MTVYILLVFFIILMYFLGGRHAIANAHQTVTPGLQKCTRGGLCLLTAYMIILIGFRGWNVGIDTSGYRDHYNLTNFKLMFSSLGFLKEIEWGYSLLLFLFKSLHFSYRMVVVLEAFCYIVPIMYIVHRNSVNPYLSCAVFVMFEFFAFSLSAVRQTFAIGICMIAFFAAKKQKLLNFVILVLLAMTFHITAVVFFPVYFLFQINIKKKHTIILLVIGALFFVFRGQIQQFIRQFARINYSSSETGGTGLYLYMLSLVILDVFLLPESENAEQNNIFRNMMLCAVFMYPILQFHPAVLRLHLYYSIAMVVYIPNVFRKMRNVKLRVSMLLPYLAVAFYFMLNYPLRHLGVVPYSFGF